MFEIIAKIVEETFATAWAASSASTVPIRYKNVSWKQPTSGEWVAIRIIPGDGRQASLGQTKLERQLGLVMIQVFTAKGTGERRNRVLCDIVGTAFRYKTVADSGVSVIFRSPEMGDVEERMDTLQNNVKIPFQAEKLF